jgi:O-antigen/teichoic acid export membrane protein
VIKKILGKSTIYLTTNILSSSIPFLFIPILTELLTPEEFGMVAMFQLLILFLNATLGLNVNAALDRKFFESNTKELSEYVGNSFVILGVTTSIILIIVSVTDNFISASFNIPVYWLYIGVLCSFLNFIVLVRLGQWQVRGDATKYGLIQILRTVLNFGSSILLLYLVSFGAESRLIGILFSTGFVAILSYIFIVRDRLVNYNNITKDKIIQIVNYGLPIVPHVVFNLILNSFDRIVISNHLGVGDVGIYMLAVQLGLIVNVVFTSLNKAITPFLFETLSVRGNKKVVIKLYLLLFITLTISILMSYWISPALVTLFANESYYSAKEFIFYIFAGQCLSALTLFLSNFFLFYKKTKYLSFSSIISGGVNVVLLLYLIKVIGLDGAAIAYLISKLVQLVVTIYYISCHDCMNWIFNWDR